MNASINLSAVTPSAWRARSEQKDRERQEAQAEQRIEGIKKDLEQLARDTYIQHIEACQESRKLEKRWIIRDIDIRIWFRHYTAPKRKKERQEKAKEEQKDEMETQVRVFSREIGETFVITYNRLATLKPKNSGWLLGCRLT